MLKKKSRKEKEKENDVEQIVYCKVSNCYTLRLIISDTTQSFSRPKKTWALTDTSCEPIVRP
jgi:hypothetical protein